MTEETKPKVEGGDDGVISIKVKDNTGTEVVFKVKKTTKMGKIIQAYAQRKAWDPAHVRFVFDSQRVQADDTPESLDMEDGDCVDTFLEQVGGSL